MPWEQARQSELTEILKKLISAEEYPFDSRLHGALSEASGIYAISVIGHAEGEYMRAGRTDKSLRQRIYQNHYMGNQSGNLPQQLVREKIAENLYDAKQWIRANCRVQFLVVENFELRRWAEHFILSVLRPKFSD